MRSAPASGSAPTGAQPDLLTDEGSLTHARSQPGRRLATLCNAATGKRAVSVAGFNPAGWFRQSRDDAQHQFEGAVLMESSRALPKSPSEGAGKKLRCPDLSAAPSPQGYRLFQQLL